MPYWTATRAASTRETGVAMATNLNPFDESCLSKDVLVPSVARADLKSVWAMKNEFQARHPGQQVSIGVGPINA